MIQAAARSAGKPQNNELVLAGLTVGGITIFYLGLSLMIGLPEASSLIGHSIGVIGFVLMLATETLYSIRKRARQRPIGRLSDWLKFHIFTGIVGPYMVFLHSAWKFQGLAGVTLLLTGLIVLSGFLGRYIYTAVPRTSQGIALEAAEISAEINAAAADLDRQLAVRGLKPPSISRMPKAGLTAVLTRGISQAFDRAKYRRWQRGLAPEEQAAASEIARLIDRQRTLQQQIANLSAARRLLALWHMIHVPIGLTLFIFAFIHAGAAMYYATLLK